MTIAVAGLYTEQVRDTLRSVLMMYVGELHDDPYDATIELMHKLEDAGRFLGVDIWDRNLIYQLGFYKPTDCGYEQLRKIAGR